MRKLIAISAVLLLAAFAAPAAYAVQPDEIMSDPAKEARARAESPFGSMSSEERRDAYVAAIEKTIVPGFDRAGLGASEIWKNVERGRA